MTRSLSGSTHIVARWLFVLFWLWLIAHFSNQTFEAQDLSSQIYAQQWLIRLVGMLPHIHFHYVGSGVDNYRDPIEFVQFFIRKGVHLFTYGVLGMSFLSAMRASGVAMRRWWPASFFFVGLVASIDEHHQSVIAHRTGCPQDVGLDLLGFLLAIIIIKTFTRRHGGEQQVKQASGSNG